MRIVSLSPTPIFLYQYDATLEIYRNLLDKNICKRVNWRSSEPESWTSNSTEQLYLTNRTRARLCAVLSLASL
jgi:hypothetical protein